MEIGCQPIQQEEVVAQTELHVPEEKHLGSVMPWTRPLGCFCSDVVGVVVPNHGL